MSSASPEMAKNNQVAQGVASELMSSFDAKWQQLTYSRPANEAVQGAWTAIKRSVVQVLGPAGFSLLARAREMMGKDSVELSYQEVAELMIALELGATPDQRRALQPVLDQYYTL